MTEALTSAELISRYKAARARLAGGAYPSDEAKPTDEPRFAPVVFTPAFASASKCRAIIRAVSAMGGTSAKELTGRSRRGRLDYWRTLAVCLIAKHTPYGALRIGRIFNRDHSTVAHLLNVTGQRVKPIDFARAEQMAFERRIQERRT